MDFQRAPESAALRERGPHGDVKPGPRDGQTIRVVALDPGAPDACILFHRLLRKPASGVNEPRRITFHNAIPKTG